jgi:hypothetical protein
VNGVAVRLSLLSVAMLLLVQGWRPAAVAAARDAGDADRIRQSGPSVEIEVVGDVLPGRPNDVVLRAANPAPDANQGSITVSLPGNPNVEIVNASAPGAKLYQPGESMFNFGTGGNAPISVRAVELFLASWPAGARHELRLRLTSNTPYTIQARASFRRSNGTFVHLPANGRPDQQGAPTRVLDVTPQQPVTPTHTAAPPTATSTSVPPTPTNPPPTSTATPRPTDKPVAQGTDPSPTGVPVQVVPPAPVLGGSGRPTATATPAPAPGGVSTASGPSIPLLLAGFGIIAVGVAVALVAVILIVRRRDAEPRPRPGWQGPPGEYPGGPFSPGNTSPLPASPGGSGGAPYGPSGTLPWDASAPRPAVPPWATAGEPPDQAGGGPPPWKTPSTPFPPSGRPGGNRPSTDWGQGAASTPFPTGVEGLNASDTTAPQNERYTERVLVGRGGMGSVYRAYDSRLRRWVALKIMHADLGLRPGFLDRFIREAQVAAMLEHPNIVTVYDIESFGTAIQMVMSWIDGEDLQKILEREGALPPARAAALVTQMAAALDHAHLRERPVLHRDIKPSNVMIAANDRAILTDFGIARLIGDVSLTQTGQVVGTPAFMAPEIVQGAEADARADIYALAVVLYQMVTGQAPFRAETPLALLHAHVNTPPPPPRTVLPSLPPSVDQVLAVGLAKDPQVRFQTAGALARAFRASIGLP